MTEAECRAEIRKFFMELYPACTVIYSYPGNAARPPASCLTLMPPTVLKLTNT